MIYKNGWEYTPYWQKHEQFILSKLNPGEELIYITPGFWEYGQIQYVVKTKDGKEFVRFAKEGEKTE